MSQKYDLLITGARIITETGTLNGMDLGISGSQIAGIHPRTVNVGADKTLDASGKVIFPGAIDLHVHIRAPGRPDREDFFTGTRAAANGGVTTLMEMPVSEPPVYNAEILKKRMEFARGKIYVDVGFYGGAAMDNVMDIAEMADAGAFGFKTFMHAAPPGREADFKGICAGALGDVYDVAAEVGKTKLPWIVHCEDDSIIQARIEKLKREGRRDPMAHIESRPPEAEMASALGILSLAQAFCTRVHFPHISTAKTARAIKLLTAGDPNFTVESCHHYLYFGYDDMRRAGPYAKINPPFRSMEDMIELRRAVSEGIVDTIGSDHAGWLPQDKNPGWDSIFNVGSGGPGIEFMFPIMLDLANRGTFSLQTVADVLSHKPARIFGLYPEKGHIAVGARADLTLVDLNKTWVVDPYKLETKIKETNKLYEGLEFKGAITDVFVAGRAVMEKGSIVAEEPFGNVLKGPMSK